MRPSRIDGKILLASLGAEIRSRREKLGISQALLASRAGVHLNVIGRTERGIYNPRYLTLRAIAKALKTSMTALLRGASK